jgi:hypothetical protein
MLENPFVNRLAIVVLFATFFVLGHDLGRNQVAQAHHNNPNCYQHPKP